MKPNDHHIEIWNKHKQCYEYYDEFDFEIDGDSLIEHDWKIRAKAIDECRDLLIDCFDADLDVAEYCLTLRDKMGRLLKN